MIEDARMFIAGRWTGAASEATFVATSPSTGRPIARIPEGSRADAERAIRAAAEAAPHWGRASAFERSAALARIARRIDERRDELARTLALDQGKPLEAEARAEVEELIAYVEMAAGDATRIEGLLLPSVSATKRVLVYRVPRGVVGVISPWNWPYTMPAEIIAPALAAGDTVVWNPASTTSLCAVRLAECIVEADLPPGVFNLVTGPGSVVGDEIAAHPLTSTIGFIGSTETGRRVAERAAGKELLLEMGGNGPLVVLDDADVEAAVAGTLSACFLNAGQSCTAGERILVAEPVHDSYLAALEAAIDREVRLGDPFDPATTMGPLNNEPTVAKTERHVADAVERGARLVRGGRRAPECGSPLFYEPTVLDGVDEAMAVAREETFGPVVPITTIGGLDDALAAIERSPYGLLAAVYTRDLERGLRFAEAARTGWVNVNEGTNYWESHLPFGGRAGTGSGVGRVGGRFPIERLTELKTVVLNLG
ncbi:MAG TPA: aldehyde dehydrogenase family protein [Candidatus Limnocylindrales bacterium]|nr:aldehyde dehydrogenase family protein [Candidatus Limnocylindrales bacterium]